MMADGLSVLIPCYRYDPAPLVEALLPQLSGLPELDWEIVVGNDYSGPDWDASFDRLSQLSPNLRIMVPDHNLGRAGIRNRMAREAQYETLLFIDADSLPVRPDYLKNYLTHASEADVLVGGTAYRPYPGHKDSLRYRYGMAREATSAVERSAQPFHRIALNNVLARRSVWQEIPLNEAIIGYGHEDTYWGLALEWADKSIRHLDNPVYHIGLEYNETFLSKCRDAATNLAHLVSIGLIPAENARLSTAGEKLLHHKARLAILLSLKLARPQLIKMALQAGKFSLKALDLLKLDAYVTARLENLKKEQGTSNK